jgi:hypothetical protein
MVSGAGERSPFRPAAVEKHHDLAPGGMSEPFEQTQQLVFVVRIGKVQTRKGADQVVTVDQIGHPANSAMEDC